MIWYIALALVMLALVFGLGMSWDKSDDRIRQLRERLQLVDAAEQRESRPSLALIRDDLMSEIPALNRWLDRMGRGTALRAWLRQADLSMRPGKFVMLCATFGLGAGIVTSLFTPWYAALALALPGAALPYAWAHRRRSQRMAAFQAQFPEAIDLLVRASRAGHPPSAALELISSEMPSPISGEFRQVFDQQRFGLPLRDCLLNLAERVPLVDVQFFATSMIIQRESGGNLAEILEKLSYVIRERVKIMRQVKTHTAQGRMTLYVLVGMAPVMLIALMLLNHKFMMPMFTDPMGRAMMIVAAVLQVVGIFLLNKIVNIEV